MGKGNDKTVAVTGPSFSFSNVSVQAGRNPAAICSVKNQQGCPPDSDLIYIPEHRTTGWTLAVVETGSDSKLNDKAAAELEARKEALKAALGGVASSIQPGPG